MPFGIAVNTGSNGSLTYSDTEGLHAGVVILSQMVELLDTIETPTANPVTIDFTASANGFTKFAVIAMPTGCAMAYGNPGGYWYFGPWRNQYLPCTMMPNVTLNGTVATVTRGEYQFSPNTDPQINMPESHVYQAVFITIIGIK